MDALIPFVVQENAPVWESADGRRYLKDMVSAAHAHGRVETVYVVTDRPELFRGVSATVVEAPGPGQDDPGCAPPGAAWAMKALRAAGFELSPNLLVANIRNPFLNAGMLSAAIDGWETSGLPLLVSAVVPDDHPCQFVTPSSIEEMGVLCLFEEDLPRPDWLPEAWAAGVVASKPFAFDWNIPGTDNALFLRRLDQEWDGAFAAYQSQNVPTHPVWVRVGAREARVLMPREVLARHWGVTADITPRLRGANILRFPGDPPVLALEGPEPGTLTLTFPRPGHAPGDRVLKCMSCSAKACENMARRTITFDGGGGAAVIVSGEHASRIMYLLLSVESDAACEMLLPYAPEDAPWAYDVTQGICRNTVSGQLILGRQQFPDVYSLDGTLLIGKHSNMECMDELSEGGIEMLYLLERQWNIKDDRLVIAQYLALVNNHGADR